MPGDDRLDLDHGPAAQPGLEDPGRPAPIATGQLEDDRAAGPQDVGVLDPDDRAAQRLARTHEPDPVGASAIWQERLVAQLARRQAGGQAGDPRSLPGLVVEVGPDPGLALAQEGFDRGERVARAPAAGRAP